MSEQATGGVVSSGQVVVHGPSSACSLRGLRGAVRLQGSSPVLTINEPVAWFENWLRVATTQPPREQMTSRRTAG